MTLEAADRLANLAAAARRRAAPPAEASADTHDAILLALAEAQAAMSSGGFRGALPQDMRIGGITR
jgi:hypothetical protein